MSLRQNETSPKLIILNQSKEIHVQNSTSIVDNSTLLIIYGTGETGSVLKYFNQLCGCNCHATRKLMVINTKLITKQSKF